ncbi:SDR family oxidoreductase [Dongia sedimenti]|uniref:SDR family oxidoreductase n=1 Tax=Dongia sedimenti TaxID=3064282 RepID=A0ABU0YTE6_9PROT|nr:SDR family oxidoreductase [Rhodospirillaceae bacterium R-7]
MKIVVIGGSGLIGSNVVSRLQRKGHDVFAASPKTGVNALTGEGLADVLAGAQIVVDVANAPNFEDHAVLEFFQTAGRNLLAAEANAGVRHHIALSVVGADRLPQSGYLRAKLAQEALIKTAAIPYTILRSCQFFEFAGSIAQSATNGRTIRLPIALMQPVASDDVSALLARIAGVAPLNLTVEIGGPELIGMDDFVRRFLQSQSDQRQVIGDPQAQYFGTALDNGSLTPGRNPHTGAITFDAWLNRALAAA